MDKYLKLDADFQPDGVALQILDSITSAINLTLELNGSEPNEEMPSAKYILDSADIELINRGLRDACNDYMNEIIQFKGDVFGVHVTKGQYQGFFIKVDDDYISDFAEQVQLLRKCMRSSLYNDHIRCHEYLINCLDQGPYKIEGTDDTYLDDIVDIDSLYAFFNYYGELWFYFDYNRVI